MWYLNKKYSKKEMMAYVSNMRQIAGAERLCAAEGNAEGAKLIRAYNGSGIEFTVIESRCMDMLSLSYKGIPMNFLSKNGLVYPVRYQPYDAEDTLKYLTGGMFYTCGTANVGWECIDGGQKQANHGRIKSMSATNTTAKAMWIEDDYAIEISGEMRETSLFGENVVLRRKIQMKAGENRIRIIDEIENESFTVQPFMYMYHMNLGFPMIDRETEVFTQKAMITVRDKVMEMFIPDYKKIEGPEYPGKEICLMHEFEEKGMVTSGVFNHRLGIGFYVKQDTHVMPFLHEWKTNIAGTYALGLEPANCHCEGRVRERDVHRTLQYLQPFEPVKVEIEIGIVEDRKTLDDMVINNLHNFY